MNNGYRFALDILSWVSLLVEPQTISSVGGATKTWPDFTVQQGCHMPKRNFMPKHDSGTGGRPGMPWIFHCVRGEETGV